MDPTANLQQQLTIATRILRDIDCERKPSLDDTERLAELVIALDGWIHRNGHLPQQWQQEI